MLSCFALSPTVLVFSFSAHSRLPSNSYTVLLGIAEHCRASNAFSDIVPASSSITLYLKNSNDRAFWQHEILSNWQSYQYQAAKQTIHRIPVRYGVKYGQDFNEVCERLSLSSEAVIDLHTSATFVVSFMGFLPGFGYLTGLPDALTLPRKATPIARVPKGSIAIAESLTAIYPSDSPGGWYLIGQTECELFDLTKPQPCLFAPGDIVKFEACND